MAWSAMRLAGLAFDYDGTLAHDGRVDPAVIDALRRARDAGRKLFLVTGRQLEDLQRVCDAIGLFDAVVAENGAVLYLPPLAEARALGPSPPAQFVEMLRRRGVDPLSVGRCIVATLEPQEGAVREAIDDLGLGWRIILNKGAVMCLPAGVDKASGLAAALAALQLSPRDVLGVGDAENDQAFLAACGCSAAVANALETLKRQVDIVTAGEAGAGVVEIIDRVLEGYSPSGGSPPEGREGG